MNPLFRLPRKFAGLIALVGGLALLLPPWHSPAQQAADAEPLPGFETPDRSAPEDADAPFDPFADDARRVAEADMRKAAEPTAAKADVPGGDGQRVAALTREVRDSIVTVTQLGRSGEVHGTGTGFVVDADKGLIATNLHVVGEGRPARVELADGNEFPVLGIHAWDRKLDLAVIRIDAGKRELQALPLGDSDQLAQGQAIVAFGNPRGLTFSVVRGVASAIRDTMTDDAGTEVDFGFPMIQLAIPIEMGNSGGPVVDLDGRVHGIVTIKWLMTDNLGFAVPVNALKPLLESPNPVPMDRWMTIGALDPAKWTTAMGATWTQRAGVVSVKGSGAGFGGRALCLSEREVPDAPYEAAVEVRLDDESGAAGLAFACADDSGEVHYGFYPSSGQLRLTRFEGPDVHSWTILDQVPSEAYRPGDWNHLRVRVEDETITCYVNGEQVIQLRDGVLRGGRVGLCKFRHTEADYRQFKVGTDLAPRTLPKKQLTAVRKHLDALAAGQPASDTMLDDLGASEEIGRAMIADTADQLEARAEELRQLGRELHRRHVSTRMSEVLAAPEDEISLLEAGLLISLLDNPQLDVDGYLEDFETFAASARENLDDSDSDTEDTEDDADAGLQRVERLRDFLFAENGFHGSRSQYYHHSNSYLNEVLDDREGLPVTLAVVFLELARLTGVEGLSGAGLPGHFMVVYRPEATPKKDGDSEKPVTMRFIDVFDGGRFLTRAEADAVVRDVSGIGIQREHLEPPSKRDIVLRMIRNLVGLEMDNGSPDVALPYIDLILDISPDEPGERFSRALLRYQAGAIGPARDDLEWLLEHRPPGIRIDRLQQLYDQLPK